MYVSGAVGIPRSNNLEDDNNSRNIELPNQDIRHEKYYWHNSFFTKNGGNLEFDLGWQRNTRREHSAPHSHGRPVDFSSDLATRNAAQHLFVKCQVHFI